MVVHSFLHLNCHDQITFAKFNLWIFYSPHYTGEVWHYKDVNTDLIRCTINNFNCERTCISTDVNQKFELFNKAIINILSNFIVQETIICDDKDSPWMTNEIKDLKWQKISLTKVSNYFKSLFLQGRLNSLLIFSKE